MILSREAASQIAKTLVIKIDDWREKIEEVDPDFTKPPRADSGQFVDTEGGEVIDALLRSKTYSRNNGRSPSVVAEIGDLLFMLISTANVGEIVDVGSEAPERWDPYAIVGYANLAYNYTVLGWSVNYAYSPVSVAIYAILCYCQSEGIDPFELIDDRLGRIFQKRKERAAERKGRELLQKSRER